MKKKLYYIEIANLIIKKLSDYIHVKCPIANLPIES